MIRVRESAALSDEQFLHLLAHEVFEVERLREEFDALGGRMSAPQLHDLTRADRRLNNLHSQAWDHADALIRRLRTTSPAAPPAEADE